MYDDDIKKARSMLNKIPNEVFDIWLYPIIKKHGFPFKDVNDNIHKHILYGYFCCTSLKLISDLDWQRLSELTSKKICLEETSFVIIQSIITNYLTDKWTFGVGPIINSKERFLSHKKSIQRTGRIETPIIFRKAPHGLLILDGSHRLAALFSINREDILFDAWVCS